MLRRCSLLLGRQGLGQQRGLQTLVGRVDMSDPGDVGPLVAWWEAAGRPRVRAILGKTEGNGCVNDFSRGYATMAIKKSAMGMACPDACVVMSGGTEGVLTPHFVVFAEADKEASARWGRYLSVGVSRTRVFKPEEIGAEVQARETAAAVRLACEEAKLEPSEVAFAQIKCPLLTSDRLSSSCVTQDTYESMAWSRAASAIGVGIATGEISDETSSSSGDFFDPETRFSNVASTSAGVELLHSEVVVLGNGLTWGRYRVAGGVMNDALDVQSVVRCLSDDLGVIIEHGQLTNPKDVAALLCKADPAPLVRGARTTMLTDSDFNATRHSRAAIGGLLAGLFGDTRLFVSGGAENQGPPGGGPFLIIYDEVTGAPYYEAPSYI